MECDRIANLIRQQCTECGACVKHCAFLRRHGTPKAIAAGQRVLAYACSLCGLCAAVCPEGLDPCRLFRTIRCRHAAEGGLDCRPYRGLLLYERLGCSSLLAWSGIPPGCDTVFFPGCALPGTRPEATVSILARLRRILPSVGMVLACCAKPSHDLGRLDFCKTRLGKTFELLRQHGIRTVLTACPSCTGMLRQYGEGLVVRTVWEELHAAGTGTPAPAVAAEICIHDPCSLRHDRPFQAAVRGLLADLGYRIVPMAHQDSRTVCCGEGGAVGCIDPGLAGQWTSLRTQAAAGRLLVAACCGCTSTLNRFTPTVHLADLLFRPEAGLRGALDIAQPPFTYWNRLRLKGRLRRMLQR
ncbi:(Fe-S)-binding protein [Desulfobulbus sp.]|uniref:(Fe-S)-binding protein n=1 Tax=Desulfobulbus sp. TaxID=895 RepID=UPI00286FAE61|nr:(Fe-S)-binding protein [Desulfobulbus sp.]